MNEKNLILPFVTKMLNKGTGLSYPEEVAYVTCIAESQRKKPGFLRDTSEKLASISKVFCPLWVLAADNSSLILDGLCSSTFRFSFEEPIKIGQLIEEIKKSSIFPKELIATLRNEVKTEKEFGSLTTFSFANLIDNRDLLSFLVEYFKTGSSLLKDQKEANLIPFEIDASEAIIIIQSYLSCLRSIRAFVKGLQYVIETLKEESSFQKNAALGEIELLKEKLSLELETQKPIVEKKIGALVKKQDKALSSLQKGIDLRISNLEKKRGRVLQKLETADKRIMSLQKKVNAVNERKKSSKTAINSFTLEKYEKEIDKIKREIRIISDDIEKHKKDGEMSIKLKRTEFQSAIAQEENKLRQIEDTFETKINEKKRQIDEIIFQIATLTSNLEKRIYDLERSSNTLRNQVEVNWKQENPEEPVLVYLPVYLVKYTKQNEERYNLISPIQISEDTSLMNELKKILFTSDSKLKSLIHPSNKMLQEKLSIDVLGKIKSDATFEFKIKNLCRANNLIDQNNFGLILNEGLDEIERKGWIAHEEAIELCRHLMRE